jgi:hypothetical protein
LVHLRDTKRHRYDSIGAVEPIFDAPGVLEIDVDGVFFELYASLVEDSPHLLVFGQGAVDREKFELPVFQRWSWALSHPSSVLVLNDPTLYQGKIPLGWFQGTAERSYLPDAVAIVGHIAEHLGRQPTDVLFYGSSGGGFTSLAMAAMMRGACALANNPQTDVTRYYKSHVTALLEAGFGGIPIKEARERYAERMNLVRIFRKLNHVPDFYYVQNTQDVYHLKSHFMPFMKQVNDMILNDESKRTARVFTELYASDRNHSPLDQEDSLQAIERARELLLPVSDPQPAD